MFSSQFILDVKIVGSTSRGHTGFLIHLPSAAVLALIFLVRRIQPFLSLVDREVEFLRANDLQYRPASKKLKYRLEAGFLIFLGA